MSKGTMGSWEGMVVPGANMVDIFKASELAIHPNSLLQFTDMTIIKIGIITDPDTEVLINGDRVIIPTNIFELALNVLKIKSMVFASAVYAKFTFMY